VSWLVAGSSVKTKVLLARGTKERVL
jgi:hypothetical protein